MAAPLAVALSTLGCMVLLWSALEKLVAPSELPQTLQGLGGAREPARVMGAVVVSAELVGVAAVAANAPVLIASPLIAVLGLAYAAAAGWSPATHRTVRCACFGRSGRSLGWVQIAALPLWLLVAASYGYLPDASDSRRSGLAALGALLLVVVRALTTLNAMRMARSDRRAVAGG